MQVIKADYFALDSKGHNTTLQMLQEDLVASLNKAASLNNGLGFTAHVVCGKADWKFRKDWLQSKRSYSKYINNAEGLCQRCLATKDDWLDIEEKFNDPAKIQAALRDAVGDIALTRLSGWSSTMEVPDLLHVVWTGVARDLVGTLCMEVAEVQGVGVTYDERLRALRIDMQQWCTKHDLRPSCIEDLSAQTSKNEAFICSTPAVSEPVKYQARPQKSPHHMDLFRSKAFLVWAWTP